jgi:hypothetical protein
MQNTRLIPAADIRRELCMYGMQNTRRSAASPPIRELCMPREPPRLSSMTAVLA